MIGDRELRDMAQATKVSVTMVLDAYNTFMKETHDNETALRLTDTWFKGIMNAANKNDDSNKLF